MYGVNGNDRILDKFGEGLSNRKVLKETITLSEVKQREPMGYALFHYDEGNPK